MPSKLVQERSPAAMRRPPPAPRTARGRQPALRGASALLATLLAQRGQGADLCCAGRQLRVELPSNAGSRPTQGPLPCGPATATHSPSWGPSRESTPRIPAHRGRVGDHRSERWERRSPAGPGHGHRPWPGPRLAPSEAAAAGQRLHMGDGVASTCSHGLKPRRTPRRRGVCPAPFSPEPPPPSPLPQVPFPRSPSSRLRASQSSM